MARVKGGAVSKNRRRKVLKQAKGYFGSKHRLYKTAQEQLFHSGAYAFRDRKQNKRNFRKLWITRINAACRENDISYSKFINGLNKAGIEINRKMLSELAIDDPKSFTALVVTAKKALLGEEIKAEVKETVKEVKKETEKVAKVVKEKIEEVKEDLESMSLADLKALAKEKGLKGFSTLKKDELIKIITDYNKMCEIFDETKIEDTKSKKDVLVEKINEIKNKYLKYLIMSLDLKDYESLKNILKKNDTKTLNEHKELINYFIDKHIIFQKDNLEVPNDLEFKRCFKNKDILKYVKKWNRIYDLANGIIIAYGVVSKKYFSFIISGIEEKDKIISKLEFYYKKEYIIEDKMIVSTKLSNKKRINKYFKDNNYKCFTNKEYVEMGKNIYHHNIKSYKKLIKTLKNFYVFKNKDIKFIDDNIVIPYLYNSLNEEDIANKNLEETIISLFEFKGDKLKNKLLQEISKIRNEFPLWEYRGFTKMEVNK